MKNSHLFLKALIIISLSGCSKIPQTFTVNFEGKTSSTVWAAKELNPELPADWSKSGFLTFEMKSSTTQLFDLRVYDTSGIRRVTIHPFQGAWVRASIPLVHFQTRNTKGMDMAAIGKTARPGYWIGFSNQVGPITNVDSIGVTMRQPIGKQILEIRNIQLTMNAMDTIFSPVPLIDEFGQWIPAEWEGKVKTEEELKAKWEEEDKSLVPGSFNLSKYGGFTGTKAKATGFFRVEKIDGVWWFIDPEGFYFYSTGTTGIGPRSEFARIKGREYAFKAMPPAAELTQQMNPAASSNQAARPAAATNYSFYSWNLYRRFGTDW